MKKVFKYPTGAEIPEGAIYLSSITQTEIECEGRDLIYHLRGESKYGEPYKTFKKCWLVWHYFLVEVEKS